MAGAERQGGFYFDADAVDGDARTVMAPVHNEAAGRHRLEPLKAGGNPIALGDGFESQCVGVANDIRNKIPNCCLIRARMKIYSDRPSGTGRLG
jgi:hypothetical protein